MDAFQRDSEVTLANGIEVLTDGTAAQLAQLRREVSVLKETLAYFLQVVPTGKKEARELFPFTEWLANRLEEGGDTISSELTLRLKGLEERLDTKPAISKIYHEIEALRNSLKAIEGEATVTEQLQDIADELRTLKSAVRESTLTRSRSENLYYWMILMMSFATLVVVALVGGQVLLGL